MSKRPFEMSDAEREALPVGPWIRMERPLTPEERARGMAGRSLIYHEAPAQGIVVWGPKDIFGWRDSSGQVWDFGRWADGGWFKQPSVLG